MLKKLQDFTWYEVREKEHPFGGSFIGSDGRTYQFKTIRDAKKEIVIFKTKPINRDVDFCIVKVAHRVSLIGE